jgi:subtilisin-like proprotein convertase family protein
MSRAHSRSTRVCLEALEDRAVPHGAGEAPLNYQVDAAGHEYCSLLPVAPDSPDSSPPADPHIIVPANTFKLHSLPSAEHVIYLDFNGHTTSHTWWNSFTNGADIVSPAFDLDGDPSTFSSAELLRIQMIWDRVAEDFSPFDVDVTTEEPPANQLANDGIRAIIGGNGSWFGKAGGVAFIGVFGNRTDIGCFIFPDNLGSGNEKYVADGISHEVGHTLGLLHHGVDLPGTDNDQEYFQGHGSGATSWGPIMGAPFNSQVTQWSKGEYANAASFLNGEVHPSDHDLEVITSRNGFGYRPDDHGNDITTASPATVIGGTKISGTGVIERNTDVDFFSFDAGTGPLSIDVTGDARSPDLDIRAELYNSAGILLAWDDPPDSLSAHLSANVSAGIYFLKIDGVGTGDPLTDGYSDYASLGQYKFNGTVVEPPPPAPLRVLGIYTRQTTNGTVNGFRLTFNEPPDPSTLQPRDLHVTGPAGRPVAVTSVRRVPGTLTVFDIAIAPQRLSGTGGVRIDVPPSARGARGGKSMDQDGDGVPGEPTDFFAGAAFRFDATGGLIADNGVSEFPLTIPNARPLTIRDLNVRVNVQESSVGQLQIDLVSPTGSAIPLFVNHGSDSNYLRNTVFDDQAAQALNQGSAPFAGVFKPEGGSLADVNGLDGAGTWKLRITDATPGDFGRLLSWSLMLTTDDARSAPVLTNVVPVNSTGSSLALLISGLTLTFDRLMNAATVTRRDIRITDPSGHPVAVRSMTPDPVMGTLQFRVVTRPWTKAGMYTVRIGPAMSDMFGNAFDVNGNGTFLEPADASVTTLVVPNDVFAGPSSRTIPRGRTTEVSLLVNRPVKIDDLAIEINLQHPSVGNLKITLIAPNGTQIVLVDHRGGAGGAFTETVFSASAAMSISSGSAPFNGEFKPEDEAAMAGLIGTVAKGKWTLKIEDTGIDGAGELQSWRLFVRSR